MRFHYFLLFTEQLSLYEDSSDLIMLFLYFYYVLHCQVGKPVSCTDTLWFLFFTPHGAAIQRGPCSPHS